MADFARAGGASHRAVGAIGVAPQGNRPTGLGGHGVHHCGNIREVCFERVSVGVRGGAETAPVHRVVVRWSRSTAMNGAKVVWSAMEPWTITSAGPVPSTHTATGVPSADATSKRSTLLMPAPEIG